MAPKKITTNPAEAWGGGSGARSGGGLPRPVAAQNRAAKTYIEKPPVSEAQRANGRASMGKIRAKAEVRGIKKGIAVAVTPAVVAGAKIQQTIDKKAPTKAASTKKAGPTVPSKKK